MNDQLVSSSSTRGLEALAVLGAGAVAATTLLLFATGRTRAAYSIALASTIMGSVFGALRVYTGR